MQDFRNLLAWQKAHSLTKEVFAISATWTGSPHYVLRNQMVRAALSVPSNLAEGAGRTGDREFRRFVRIALGSASELEYHLLLARDLGLVPDVTYDRLARCAADIKRMLTGLAAKLSTKPGTDG